MNFNEFHNSEYWARQRMLKAGQITIVQLVMILCGCITFFGLMWLAIFMEG